MPHSQTVVTAHRESGAAKQSIGPDIEKGVVENEDRSKADEDACSKLWAVYAGEAEKYDGELLRGWKQDMEGLLIFSALYSASLTAFIIESYKTLQEDPAETTVTLLKQISQQLNGTTIILETQEFQPPLSSVVCNIFWFLALALALSCSLLATFVQQWTRDFIHKTNLRPSPVRRAKSHMSLYFGIRRFGMHTVVDIIPFLLHLSLFLFFAGLVLFLIPVNNPLRHIMTCVLAVLVAVYLCFTILPIVYLDAPFRTPLSGFIWSWGNVIGRWLQRFHNLRTNEDLSLTEGAVERSYSSVKHDKKALEFTMKSLTDDLELLPLIEAIPDAIISSEGPRSTNVSLIAPFLISTSPSLNIISHIATFGDNPSAWLDERLGIRCLRAYPRAIWALAYASASNNIKLEDWNQYSQQIVDITKVYFPLSIERKLSDSQSHSATSALALLRLNQLLSLQTCMALLKEGLQSGDSRYSAMSTTVFSSLCTLARSTSNYSDDSPLETVRSMIRTDVIVPLQRNGDNSDINIPESLDFRGTAWLDASIRILGDFLEKSMDAESKSLYMLTETYACLSQNVMHCAKHAGLSGDTVSLWPYMYRPILVFGNIAYKDSSSDKLFICAVNQFHWNVKWAHSSQPEATLCRNVIQECFVQKTFDALQVWKADEMHHIQSCILADLDSEWGDPDKYLPAFWLSFHCSNQHSAFSPLPFARKVCIAIRQLRSRKSSIIVQHELYPFIRTLAEGIVLKEMLWILDGWAQPDNLEQTLRLVKDIGTELLPEQSDIESFFSVSDTTKLDYQQRTKFWCYLYSLQLFTIHSFIAECIKSSTKLPPYCLEAFQAICLLYCGNDDIDVNSQNKFSEAVSDLLLWWRDETSSGIVGDPLPSSMFATILGSTWDWNWITSPNAARTLITALDRHEELHFKSYSADQRNTLLSLYHRCKEVLEDAGPGEEE